MTKTTIDSTLLEQISKELDALKRRGVFGDFDGVADALKAAMAEPQDPDSWGAGYEAGYAAGVAEHPAQPVQEQRERELNEVLTERDDAEDFIDALLDEVLGPDRAEWSSAYGRADALEEVRERIAQMLKPSIDKAWNRFEAALEQPAQPVQEPEPLDQLKRLRDVLREEVDRLIAAKAEPVQEFALIPGTNVRVRLPVQEPVLDPDNGGKTGWPPGLLQDDCRGLSKWLASRPDARQRLREALAEQEQDTDCHAQGICQRSGYCIVQRKPLTETSAERTLKRMGYTDCGAELWKPPLGDPAQPSLPTNAEIAWKMGYEAGKCEANGVLDAILPPSLVKPVGIVSHLVKGDVVWQRWPADMPDGTRLWGEVQP